MNYTMLANFRFSEQRCYSDTPILGNFKFSPTLLKAINRSYVILSIYQYYVLAINRYYAILSVFAKITLYRYNVKTDIT